MPGLIHVVGARPNFIKAAPVIAALRAAGVPQRLVHTGQHYDRAMSDVFFEELGLPEPDLNLGVGSGSHGAQTAALLVALEEAFLADSPDLVVVYGDVNSTLAAALVCAKLLIPVAHVEAGLRSFDPTMPEEVNRRVTDLLSDPLFVTAPEGEVNLAAEGISGERVVFVGNPMIDTLLAHLDRLEPGPVMARLGVRPRTAWPRCTGRPTWTAPRPRPRSWARCARPLGACPSSCLSIRGVAPRCAAAGLRVGAGPARHRPARLRRLPRLSSAARPPSSPTPAASRRRRRCSDVPCLTLRPNTERPITLTAGTNRLVTPADLGPALDAALAGAQKRPGDGPPGWDGHAGERIAAVLIERSR